MKNPTEMKTGCETQNAKLHETSRKHTIRRLYNNINKAWWSANKLNSTVIHTVYSLIVCFCVMKWKMRSDQSELIIINPPMSRYMREAVSNPNWITTERSATLSEMGWRNRVSTSTRKMLMSRNKRRMLRIDIMLTWMTILQNLKTNSMPRSSTIVGSRCSKSHALLKSCFLRWIQAKGSGLGRITTRQK